MATCSRQAESYYVGPFCLRGALYPFTGSLYFTRRLRWWTKGDDRVRASEDSTEVLRLPRTPHKSLCHVGSKGPQLDNCWPTKRCRTAEQPGPRKLRSRGPRVFEMWHGTLEVNWRHSMICSALLGVFLSRHSPYCTTQPSVCPTRPTPVDEYRQVYGSRCRTQCRPSAMGQRRLFRKTLHRTSTHCSPLEALHRPREGERAGQLKLPHCNRLNHSIWSATRAPPIPRLTMHDRHARPRPMGELYARNACCWLFRTSRI
ncbi:hypothetical protein F4780DRAFT_364946 [Xylariomycetidae sp. FL0641]|nr:hypothetical protein F4780DRAFT_364946 [Xylariomycetidae sp. FL0641]